MSDSIFHHIFFPDIIPSYLFFCRECVCLSLFICYSTLLYSIYLEFSLLLLLLLLLFLAVHFFSFLFFLSCFWKTVLVVFARQYKQLLTTLSAWYFFLFVYYVDVEQWRMCAYKQSEHITMHNACLYIFIWKSAKNEISQNGIAIILNVVQRVKVRDDI